MSSKAMAQFTCDLCGFTSPPRPASVGDQNIPEGWIEHTRRGRVTHICCACVDLLRHQVCLADALEMALLLGCLEPDERGRPSCEPPCVACRYTKMLSDEETDA